MGYIVGFSIIFLIISSNLMIYNGNPILAYNLLNKVSSDVLDRYPIIPIKDTKRDFGNPYFTSNPILQELKNRLCENKPDDMLCNPLENSDDKSKDKHNDDSSAKLNKRMEKLNQKLSEPCEGNKAKDKNNDDDKHETKKDELKLKIEKKQDQANKELEKLKDKINKENNKYQLKQDEENKAKDKNNKDKNNDDDKHELKITGLDLKIQNIRDNLDKKLDKL